MWALSISRFPWLCKRSRNLDKDRLAEAYLSGSSPTKECKKSPGLLVGGQVAPPAEPLPSATSHPPSPLERKNLPTGSASQECLFLNSAGTLTKTSHDLASNDPRSTIVLPRDYAECDISHIVAMISDVMEELIRSNDECASLPNAFNTRFHSR
jgi:hypothetical protein